LAPEHARKRRRTRSASADIQEEDDRGRPTFFEELPQRTGDDEVPEFEPVEGEGEGPAVDWEGEEQHMQRRWEDLLEDLFGPAGGDRAPFDVVDDGLRWADGEVIWEGMDFEQLFGNPDEFRAFEQMDAAAKRRFLREKLLAHQASGAAEAGDTEIERTGAQRRRPARAQARPRPPPRPGGPTMPSEASATERRPGEMESGLGAGGRRHRHHRGAD
jgi:hypothetical protein